MELARGRTSFRRITPICRKIRDFLAESKKYQNLYSNLEGSYPVRIFKRSDDDILKKFICNSLYFTCSDNGTSSAVTDKVNILAQNIITESIKYDKNEIHMFIVWVVYYEYESNSTGHLPVFKLYKGKTLNNEVFMDVNGYFYKSWEEYLDKSCFPDSFLCVPRHGKYVRVPNLDVLDLEFMCSSRVGSSYFSQFQPFCITIKSWFINGCPAIKKKVKKVALWFMNFFKKNYKMIILCSTAVVIGFAIFFDGKLIIIDVISMLFNEFIGTTPKALMSSLNLDVGGLSASPMPCAEVLHSKIVPKVVRELITSLENNNIMGILKAFSALFRKSRSELLEILERYPCPDWLKSLKSVLTAGEEFQKLEKYPEQIQWQDKPRTNEKRKNSEISGRTSDSFTPPQSNCTNAPDLEVINKGCEIILNDFHMLETLSNDQILQYVKSSLSEVSPANCTDLFLYTNEEGGILLLHNPTSPRLANVLEEILGKDLLLKTCTSEKQQCTVVSTPERELCRVYYPTDYIAVALIPRQVVLPEILESLEWSL